MEELLARPLGRSFFERGAEAVARDLIGCYLVRKRGQKLIKRRITETEAYIGPHDLACHAARGRTLRTEPMFGPGGTLYVYLVYGNALDAQCCDRASQLSGCGFDQEC